MTSIQHCHFYYNKNGKNMIFTIYQGFLSIINYCCLNVYQQTEKVVKTEDSIIQLLIKFFF